VCFAASRDPDGQRRDIGLALSAERSDHVAGSPPLNLIKSEFPIVQAPMASAVDADLVIAVAQGEGSARCLE